MTVTDKCVYCGRGGKLTRDHIPPKNLFAKPRPKLITVPCCDPCNATASKDDEYFRQVLVMRADIGDHPEVKKVLPALYRSWQKPTKKRFSRALLDSLTRVNVRSAGGIHLGKVPGYIVDLTRISRVLGRVAKGLFWKDSGRSLRDDYDVLA